MLLLYNVFLLRIFYFLLYNILFNRYEILQCGDVEKIIRKRVDQEAAPSYYIHRDEVFDIVKRVHISTGHGGRDKMLKALLPKYANISRDIVGIYKGLCEECVKKAKRPKQSGVVVRPVLSSS